MLNKCLLKTWRNAKDVCGNKLTSLYPQISSLVRLMKARLGAKEEKDKTSKRTQHVYRVLQSHEDELTQMLSTLSDGWKCEQVPHCRL